MRKENEELTALRVELASGMAYLGIKRNELARRTGISYSTLSDHMNNPESMRMGEYWKIKEVFRRGGYRG